jgi:hypothetical protein
MQTQESGKRDPDWFWTAICTQTKMRLFLTALQNSFDQNEAVGSVTARKERRDEPDVHGR